ncbi:hypothetical protein ABZ282_05755, partial [Amycolatopsis tolypomycina]
QCRPTPVRGLRVYLPQGTASKFVPDPGTGWRTPAGPASRPAILTAAAGGPAWRPAFVTAARETAADPKDALLLAAALGISVLLVWMLPILALVVAGPLALAAVATGGRR